MEEIICRKNEERKMSKTNFKFKVGDRVRILDGSKIENYTAGWNTWDMPKLVGQEAKITHCMIVNDKPAYWLDYSGLTWDERGLELIKNECIVIYRKGQEVIALDKVTGKKAVAKCSPEDEFDFKIGSKLAFERLLGVEHEEKVLEQFEKGKIYVFRKEIFAKRHPHDKWCSWVENCDGKVVDVKSRFDGWIDEYTINPRWCEEIGYKK